MGWYVMIDNEDEIIKEIIAEPCSTLVATEDDKFLEKVAACYLRVDP